MNILHEAARETPIIAEPDVLVVGGGAAGIAAAVAAAREGARTMLVERYGYLGGLATGGLVILLLTLDDGAGRQVIAGLCQELIDRLAQRKAAFSPAPAEWGSADEAFVQRYSRWGLVWGKGPHRVRYSVAFEPEAFKVVADEMVEGAGVQLRLHSWVTDVVVQDGKITHVVCNSKSGRQAIKPRIVIDATGDGDLFAFAGLPHEHSHVHAWRWYRMGNVEASDETIERAKNLFPSMNSPFFYTLGAGRTLMPWGISDHVDRRIDPLSVDDLTYAEVVSRRLVMEQAEALRATMPGFENAYLSDAAVQLGITDSRRLHGAYVLDAADENRPFDDTIAITGNWTKYGVRYHIPYRSLIAPQLTNLLVAGRCISVSARVHHSTKEIPPCMATGQAAGIAAALAASADANVHSVDIPALRARLRAAGAIVDPAEPQKEERTAMTETLEIGRSYTLERTVTPEVTADKFGNAGVYVFATPALVALLEETCIGCIAPTLSEGQASVGTKVDIQHLAATPLGMKVTAKAELIEVDGRRLVFRVEAADEREPIASGTHERFVVNSMAKFLARAAEKAQPK